MNKYKYRIKTEKEFIDEFGVHWRSVRCSFVEQMDYLFGLELELEIYKEHLIEGRLDLSSNFEIYVEKQHSNDYEGTWQISEKMIKELNNYPNYNEKRILIYD